MLKCETAVLQDPNEILEFIFVLQSEDVRSYLEVGSKHGGSLWRVGCALPPGSRIVSVDLPHGDLSFKETLPHLQACVEKLGEVHDAHLIIGDSTDPHVIAQARALGPFDAVFVDANHTEPYVREDWASYRPMAKKLFAFHDIGWRARPEPSKKMPIDVPKVWDEIKTEFKHKEIRCCPRDNGIGVLWLNG